MALQLIPLPIAIPFIVVFGVAWLVVLWKLRGRGKVYSFLFAISVVLLFVVILLYVIASVLS